MTTAIAAVPPRSAVPAEHTWNHPTVYESREAWEAAFKALADDLPQVSAYQGKLGESAATLADFFALAETVRSRIDRLYVYAALFYNVDKGDQTAIAMNGKAGGLFGQVLAALAFAQPEILAIGKETLDRWAQTEPRLAIYAHYFDDLFRLQQHVRSGEVEEVLGLAADPFGSAGNTISVLTDAEFTFRPAVNAQGDAVEVSQSNFESFLHSHDRALRRTAWESYADTYLAFKNTLATGYLTSVKQDVFQMRVRRYGSSLEAALFSNNVPVEVFHNLINTYKANLPTWHRYWRVRRRALGVDELHPYDIWAPLAETKPTVSFEQAVDWIYQGMKPLGETYAETLRRGCLEQRWVDRYPNQGKMNGAFSWGVQGTYPFIVMNYVNDVESVSTLAHELGHSMHSYYTWEHQPEIYSDYSMFVAEVASNFNQALVRRYLFEHNSDRAFQLALINEAMSNFHRYFFIMPTLARFELEAHERIERGEGVTADDLNALMADLFSEGYGGEMHVDRERVGITWAQFGHLYVAFYTFQYATGISAAHALAEGVLGGSEQARANYLKLLSAGSSLYPVDALKVAGVDMSQPQAVEKAFGVLAGLVDRLEGLVG